MAKSLYWADQLARKIIKEKGKKQRYTCAAGVTPSGTVHIGNFREIITAHLVERALKDAGEKVRFIYSWDDYDRFRKVPVNVPKQRELEKQIGKPVSEVLDIFGCHESWAEHFEKELEKSLIPLGIKPEYIYQNKMYKACKYAEQIRVALRQRNIIRDILNDYRREPLPEDWFPLWVFCEKCGTDFTKILSYDEEYTVEYKCQCGFRDKIDFRKKGIVALPWRVDWPMRWEYEKVDFEAGGKEHSTPGGSYTTAGIITKKIYDYTAPIYQMYDYIIIKGKGGKMSSSAGNVISIDDALSIYLPEAIRFLFAGTKPIKEFALPLDDDLLKVYEDFYKCERIYFGKEKVSDRDKAHWSRVYEMSCIKLPKSLPVQPAIRTCIEFVNIFRTPEKAAERYAEFMKIKKSERLLNIMKCVKNWLDKYASEQYKFNLQEKPSAKGLTEQQIIAIKDLIKILGKKLDEKELFREFYNIAEKNNLKGPQFFQAVYRILLNKEKGPRLAPFVLAVGRVKVAKLLKQAL